MLTAIETIIAFCAFLIVYTYLLFPLGIRFLSVLIGQSRQPSDNGVRQPSVAILCAMYNEEDVAEDKIANFKKLTYANVRLYIGSDGSSDRTNEILAQHANDASLTIYTFPRRGKVYVMNDLISSAVENILVFTDANSMYAPDAIERLVAHLDDPSVGAVCGRLHLVDKEGKSGEGFYWRFETMLKKAESVFKCVIGGNGAIYAVRRKLVCKLPLDTINDDFTISMRVIQQGYCMTYADDAVATEEVGKDDSVEFKRHVRDAAGHYRAMRHLFPLLNPLHPKRFFFYVSHRVIRWFVPQLMIVLLILPWFALGSPVVLAILISEVVFYMLALIGWLSRSKHKVAYIPYYFSYINSALFVGFIKNLLGMQKVAWDRTQRS